MLGFGVANLLVLAIYLLGITLIGSLAGRWVGSMDDYILPRRFGKSMMLMHAFGTGSHSDQAVTVANKSYTNGLSGIWYQLQWLFSTPFYWLIAPMMRRFRAITIGDIFEARYGRSASMLYAVFGMGMMMSIIGLMLKGSAAVISAATGEALSPDLCIGIITVLFVVYGAIGGLGGAIVTDFVQGVMTVVFSFLLLPWALSEVGWLGGMRSAMENPQEMFAMVRPGQIGVFFITVISLNALIGIVVQPHMMGTCAAGRTEADGQVGLMFGNMLKRLCTVAWSLTGLAGVVYFVGRDIDPDLIYGYMAHEFLPEIYPGLLGLFVASLLSTIMSSCDSFMVASSGLFAENLYKKVRPDRSDRHYILVARIAGVALVAASVLYAYWLRSVVEGLEIFWKVCPMAGVAFWLGIIWKRMNVTGAWASALSAVLAWVLTTLGGFVSLLWGLSVIDPTGILRWLQLVVVSDGDPAMYMPWQMVFYLTTGVVVGIVASLLTAPPDPRRLDRFYALLRTPVKPGEKVDEPCTLPEGGTPPPPRDLLPDSNLYLPRPSLRAVVGFLVGWACVVALIAIVWYIAVAA